MSRVTWHPQQQQQEGGRESVLAYMLCWNLALLPLKLTDLLTESSLQDMPASVGCPDRAFSASGISYWNE